MVVESGDTIRTRLSEFINLKMFTSARGLSSQTRREEKTIQTIEVKPRPILLSPNSEGTLGTNASTAKLIKVINCKKTIEYFFFIYKIHEII